MIKVGTLFSGIGAFEQGLKNLKQQHRNLFAVDNGEIEINIDYETHFNKIRKMKNTSQQAEYQENLYKSLTRKNNFVKDTYLLNHKVDDFFYDVKLFDGKKYKNKVDVLVGGSPCQSFSTVGFQAGLDDARGTLFYEFARIVNEVKPKVFIYENVKGMFTHDKGKTWKTTLEIFESLGYHFKFQLMNSVDYGIPQKRNRVFVVGFRNKKYLSKFNFPKPSILKWSLQDILLTNNSYGKFSVLKDGSISFRSHEKKYDFSEANFLSPKIKKYVMSPGTKNFKTKIEIDLSIARTVLKTMGNKHRAGVDNYVTTDGKIRMLDPVEAMRLMGFPDSFILNPSRNQSYKQAGNSIVVPVIQKITNEIIKTGVFDNE